ncbi:MAG: Hpt domain-containing protein, partial [Friedmanniella sp.]
GMDAYLTKPVRMDDFSGALSRWASQPEGVAAPEPVVDLTVMPALHGERAGSLVDLFLSTSTSQLQDMREAVAGGQTDDLRRLAHSLRGSAAYLGAGRLATACASLEEAANEQQPDLEPHVLGIDEELRQVREFLLQRFAA